MKRLYKYQVIGKNRYIPVNVTIKAISMKDAKIEFYLNWGTNITYIFKKIT